MNDNKDSDSEHNSRITNEVMEQAIDEKKRQVREALKEAENRTRTSFQSQNEYHRQMMEEARKKDDIAAVLHHRIMMETYDSILKYFSLSDSDDNA